MGIAGATTGATVGVGEGTATGAATMGRATTQEEWEGTATGVTPTGSANSQKAIQTRTRAATDNRDQGGVDINSAKGQGVFSSFVGSYLFNLDPINLFFIL